MKNLSNNMRVQGSKSKVQNCPAFTLIELLVVITIIGVLAGLTIVALRGVAKSKKISSATAEMHLLETAIDNYHNKYGVYPPGNGSNTFTAALYSPLYYELTGVSFTDATRSYYKTVDPNPITVASVTSLFNVSGILNCTKGSGEEQVNSENFLPGLSSKMEADVTFAGWTGDMLVTSVGGPDQAYAPIPTPGANVSRYKQPDPTNNNPGSYDLWVNLSIDATNANGASTPKNLILIANWNKNYQGGSTMP